MAHCDSAAATTAAAAAPLLQPGLGLGLLHHMVTGGIGGCAGAAVVYPMDVVKTRLQARKHIANKPTGGIGRFFAASLDCFVSILQEEGPRGFYRGLLPQLVGVLPDKAVKLSANEFMVALLSSAVAGPQPLWAGVVSGLFAGLCQVTFSNPREIVKIQVQLANKHPACPPGQHSASSWKGPATAAPPLAGAPAGGARRFSALLAAVPPPPQSHHERPHPLEATAETVKRLGIKGLYRGAGVCALRDMIFSAIYFPLYASFKASLLTGGHVGVGWLCLAGTLAGVPAVFFTNPIDVVKTRVHAPLPGSPEERLTYRDHLAAVLLEGGWGQLLVGVVPRLVRTAPQFGVTLIVYDSLNGALGW